MKKVFSIFVMVILIGGCATLYQLQAPVTNSVGSPDLAKYKTFTVANTSLPNTSQFLRDLPISQNVVFRFQQEGFQFVDTVDKSDFVITTFFIDAVGQKYIPPTTYTSVHYDPGVITTNTVGTMTEIGNFVNLQANSQSTSTATMTTTATTTGGYFVPNYGVAIIMNIYSSETQQLIWSGTGASEASVNDINPAIDSIILSLIDKHLITPAYIKGNREEIRKQGKDGEQDEFLRPVVSADKIGFYQVDYKYEVEGIGVLCSLTTDKRGWVSLNLSLKNNTNKEFDFKFANLKITSEGNNLYIFNKSELADAFFKSKGVFKNKDFAVRNIYSHYLEDRKILPQEYYLAYVFAALPLVFSEGSKLTVSIPLRDKNVEVDFEYQKGWMTVGAYKRKFPK